MKSEILKIVKSDPGWRKTIEDLGINIKESGDLAIFNYGIDVDNLNPVVREARGIIIDTNKCQVVCWPFTRFFNSHEEAARDDLSAFDWNNCRVEDKIDGSIVKCWHYNGEWHWSTNSCIDASEAPVQNSNKNYMDLIKSAINYYKIPFSIMPPNYTYIFELVSPESQVVIRYPETKLYHIGTRNNNTGQEYQLDIGIEKPKTYDIHTLDDCIEAATHLNDKFGNVKLEGFVVVDKDWHRIKIKSPAYLTLHHAWNNGRIVSKEKLLPILLSDEEQLSELCRNFRQVEVQLKYYAYQISELKFGVQEFVDYVRGIYEEYGHDRKAVANEIKNNALASFGFAAIGNDKTADEIFAETKLSLLCKLIPDYERKTF